jgi:hypothetical protein
MAATVHLTVVAPDNEKFTVRSAPARLPRRKPNAEYRSREHLTEREVERLIEAMKGNRWGHRDATLRNIGRPRRCGKHQSKSERGAQGFIRDFALVWAEGLRAHLAPSMRPRQQCRGRSVIKLGMTRVDVGNPSMRPRQRCRLPPPSSNQFQA